MYCRNGWIPWDDTSLFNVFLQYMRKLKGWCGTGQDGWLRIAAVCHAAKNDPPPWTAGDCGYYYMIRWQSFCIQQISMV
ncbi:MAG: hypothetical protein ACYCX2_11975 [Christensenellales bacterium]